jgi:hypothetical protein
MTLATKILPAAALLCFLAWGAVLFIGYQPLVPAADVQVTYGEQEDFFSDAAVYRRRGTDAPLLIHAPHARPDYRWWVVDFNDLVITRIAPPRSAGAEKFILKKGLLGTNIADRDALGEWYWSFTDGGAAFAGNGFTCSVRRARHNQ